MGWTIVVGGDDAGRTYKDALRDMLRDDPRVDEVVDIGVGAGDAGAHPDREDRDRGPGEA